MSDARDAALLSLVRNVVDDMGTLVAGHVRLARAELAADARGLVRRVAGVALGASLLLVGYALACVAAALALAHVFGAPLAFLAVGGVHIVGAGVALGLMARPATAGPLDESLSQLESHGRVTVSGRARRRAHRPDAPTREERTQWRCLRAA